MWCIGFQKNQGQGVTILGGTSPQIWSYIRVLFGDILQAYVKSILHLINFQLQNFHYNIQKEIMTAKISILNVVPCT